MGYWRSNLRPKKHQQCNSYFFPERFSLQRPCHQLKALQVKALKNQLFKMPTYSFFSFHTFFLACNVPLNLLAGRVNSLVQPLPSMHVTAHSSVLAQLLHPSLNLSTLTFI